MISIRCSLFLVYFDSSHIHRWLILCVSDRVFLIPIRTYTILYSFPIVFASVYVELGATEMESRRRVPKRKTTSCHKIACPSCFIWLCDRVCVCVCVWIFVAVLVFYFFFFAARVYCAECYLINSIFSVILPCFCFCISGRIYVLAFVSAVSAFHLVCLPDANLKNSISLVTPIASKASQKLRKCELCASVAICTACFLARCDFIFHCWIYY